MDEPAEVLINYFLNVQDFAPDVVPTYTKSLTIPSPESGQAFEATMLTTAASGNRRHRPGGRCGGLWQ